LHNRSLKNNNKNITILVEKSIYFCPTANYTLALVELDTQVLFSSFTLILYEKQSLTKMVVL